MTKKQLVNGLIGTAMAASMVLPQVAFAQNVTAEELLPGAVGTTIGTGTTDIRLTIASIIRTAMSLLGIIAVLIILYGGFRWMTAAGNEDNVHKAKQIIIAGIIGLIIILTAYAIASFVIGSLVAATSQV